MSKNGVVGFTLAELLIALAILGEIATFTIPKIISAQQKGQTNAAAHEVMSVISAAYQQFTLNNTLTSSATPGALTQYMNYVSIDSTSLMDDIPSFNTSFNCASGLTCLKLHSGGTLFYQPSENFSGTATTNAIHYWYDPDSTRVGLSTDGPSKTVVFVIYYNGRITSRGNVTTGTVTSTYSMNPSAAYDPSWFSW